MTGPVRVHKAQPVGDEIVFDLHLIAETEFPSTVERDTGVALHEVDAKRIADALAASLPGGTLDALLRLLLLGRASLLRRRVPPAAYREEGP